jgi:hypothetical protein
MTVLSALQMFVPVLRPQTSSPSGCSLIVSLSVWPARRFGPIVTKLDSPITKGNKILLVDEAFTILAIQNYWPKWFSKHRLKEPAKWTDSRERNSQYMGWHEDAYTWFD